MYPLGRLFFLALLLSAVIPQGFSQLRNNSDYSKDRINTDQTKFTLHENNTADFVWASEWTTSSAYEYSEKVIILLWHFKDGSKAYSRQGEILDDAGKTKSYLQIDKSSTLEDKNHGKIQPMTRTNYPVRVELWLGKVEDHNGFEPEVLGDSACFDAQSIEFNRPYTFSACRK
jgi:hypothetical protein